MADRGVSPLTEGRGLKQVSGVQLPAFPASPLTEGRGLKRTRSLLITRQQLSPLTEGRGLKLATPIKEKSLARRPSRRGVD